MTNKTRKRIADGVSYVILIFFSVLVLLPLIWMFLTSIKSMEEITLSKTLGILPQTFSLENFVKIWENYPMLTYFKNSAISVCGSTLLVIACASLCGYGLSRFEFKGKAAFMGFLLVTQMFPAVMKIVPYYQTLSALKLINTKTGLTLVYTSLCIPFCTWLMYGYFKGIPAGLDEAARIDGCTWFQSFRKIVLPLAVPGIIATTVYAFLQNWNEYMFASVLMNREANKTLTIGIAQMGDAYNILWNDLMCASILASIPTLLIFLFLQKHLISGMTSGAVKE